MRFCRKVKDAEAELGKAAAERAQYINDPVGPEDDQQPESSLAAAVADSGAGPSDPGTAPKQATLSSSAESQEPAARTNAEGELDQSEAIQSHAMRVTFDLGIQSTDGAESADGLDDFEDVLVRPWNSAQHVARHACQVSYCPPLRTSFCPHVFVLIRLNYSYRSTCSVMQLVVHHALQHEFYQWCLSLLAGNLAACSPCTGSERLSRLHNLVRAVSGPCCTKPGPGCRCC